jgi:hypothetical protein
MVKKEAYIAVCILKLFTLYDFVMDELQDDRQIMINMQQKVNIVK